MNASVELELRGLLRSVERIDRIEGEAWLHLPARVATLDWPRLEQGASQLQDGTTVTVEQVGENTTFRAEGGTWSPDRTKILFAPDDSDGQPLGMLFTSNSGWGDQLSASFQCPRAPTSVTTKLVDVEVQRHPFRLRSVPLARSAEQPEALAALDFTGHAAPLTVTFQRFEEVQSNTELVLEVANHSNKNVLTVQAKVLYLDGNGRTLEESSQTLTGDFNFDGWQPVAEAGTTAELNTFAFFKPDGARSARVEVIEVEFDDRTDWSAEN